MLPLNPLACYLAPLKKSVPSSLISEESFEHLAAVAQALPGEFARNTIGLECRLGDSGKHADLLVQATGDSGLGALATLPCEGDPDNPIWRRVRSLAYASVDQQHALCEGIEKVWLEFDAVTPGLPLPNIFFGFSDCLPPARGRHLCSAIDQHLEISRAALDLLLGSPVSTELAAELSTHFHIRSSDLQVFQVGLMLARQNDAIRLCLRSRSPECLVPYLEAVGRARDIAPVAALVERLNGRVAYLCLNLDIGSDASPKLGIECHLREPDAQSEPVNWQPLLDLLAWQGNITTEKRVALRGPKGMINADQSGDAWPEPLREMGAILGSRTECVCVWSLHHIKLVLHAGNIEAKAYLSVDYRWSEPHARSSMILGEASHGGRD